MIRIETIEVTGGLVTARRIIPPALAWAEHSPDAEPASGARAAAGAWLQPGAWINHVGGQAAMKNFLRVIFFELLLVPICLIPFCVGLAFTYEAFNEGRWFMGLVMFITSGFLARIAFGLSDEVRKMWGYP